MRPADLFSDSLTFAQHESEDLHFIGESLPPPSQVIGGDINGINLPGASSIPSREDHQHRIDLSNYYTQAEVDALILGGSLDDYYTKVESDARYYTQSAIDAAFAALDYYTQAEVDALIAGVGSWDYGEEMSWSYAEEVCNPDGQVYSSVWVPTQEITVQSIWIASRTGDTLAPAGYTVRLYVNAFNAHSTVYPTATTLLDDTTVNDIVAADSRVSVSIEMTDSGQDGDATDLAIGIRYDFN